VTVVVVTVVMGDKQWSWVTDSGHSDSTVIDGSKEKNRLFHTFSKSQFWRKKKGYSTHCDDMSKT
jgi:hypothetical protein